MSDARNVKRKICIFGVHHLYQFAAPRKKYLNSVDLVAEEATGVATTYVQQELLKLSLAPT